MNNKILVTGASRRATLTITRSLGRKGLYVIVSDHQHLAAAFLSKYCKESFLYPAPHINMKGYLECLLGKVKENCVNAFFPVHDFELVPVSINLDKFLKYTTVPFPAYDTLFKTLDKSQTLQIAEKNNVPIPETYFIDDLNDLKRISKEINYPAVIKPLSQTIFSSDKVTTSHVTSKNYVHTPDQLIESYTNIHKITPYPLIQEYVDGYGAGVGVLFNNGSPRAAFAYRRLREYPITGGPSTLRESIRHPKMVEYAIRLLKAMNWHGVAMVEFKITDGNNPVLMEVNGRFWGSLALPYYAGMDFPYLLYKMAVDGDIKPQFDYKVGVKCRWLIPGDILHLLSAVRDPNHSTHKAITDFIKFREKDLYYDFLSWDDPLPTVGAIITYLKYFGDFLRGKRSIAGEYR